jgi:hypothetical protein
MTITHILFMRVQKNNSFTGQLLEYLYKNIKVINSMDVVIKIIKIKNTHVKNKLVSAAFLKRGINELPALVTPVKIYTGVDSIISLYDKNINAQSLRKNTENDRDEKSIFNKDDDDGEDEDMSGCSTQKMFKQMEADRQRRMLPPKQNITNSKTEFEEKANPSECYEEKTSYAHDKCVTENVEDGDLLCIHIENQEITET